MTTPFNQDDSFSSLNIVDQLTATESRMARLSSLVEIGKVLSSNIELTAILESVHDQVGRVFNATNFYVATCSEKKEELIFAYQVEHGRIMPSKSNPIHTGLSGHIIRTRSSLIFQTPLELQSFTERENVLIVGEPPISWMGVPLIAGDQILGVMAIQSYDESIAYEADDLEFFTTVGTQVAIAIRNANLFKASSDKVTRLSILLEIAHSLSTKLELHSLLERVYQEVGQIFDVNNFYIATHEKGSKEWQFAFHIEEGVCEKNTRHSIEKGITGFILRTGNSLLFHSTEDMLKWRKQEKITVVGQLPASWMGVPLISQDHTVGIMAIQNYEHDNAYNKNDLALFTTIASLVASAIRKAKLYQEIATQNKTLESTNDELRETQYKLLQAQKLEAIGILAGGIAHDFNNVLTIIIGNIALAKVLSNDNSDVHELLDDAQTASQRATKLLNQLDAFSQGASPVTSLVDLNVFLPATVSLIQSGLPNRFELLFDNDLWSVKIDTNQISQSINNVLMNAVESMKQEGVITVSGYNFHRTDSQTPSLLKEKYICIKVQDTGTGIPDQYMDKIFDPYFSTKEKGSTKGSGLGLSIVHSIIKKHGGYIEVKSSEGKGTSFSIYLPAATEGG